MISDDSSFKVKIAAANQLAKISNGSLLPHLKKAFIDEHHPAVRMAVLDAISQIPDAETIPTMVYLNFHDILSIGEQTHIQSVIWQHRKLFSTSQWTRHALSSPLDKERAIAFWILGTIGSKNITPTLVKGLKDTSPLVQKRILSMLPHYPSPDSLKGCRALVGQGPGSVNAMAKLCLSLIKQRMKAPYQPVFHTPGTHGPVVEIALSPSIIGSYFQEHGIGINSRDTVASHMPTLTPVKIASFSKKQNIDVTVIASNGREVGDFRSQDMALVDNFIKTNTPLLHACYLKQLKKSPSLKGSITLSFQIQASGHLTHAGILEKTLSNRRLEQCVKQKFLELSFPSIHQAELQGQYTFHFHPPENQFFEFGS